MRLTFIRPALTAMALGALVVAVTPSFAAPLSPKPITAVNPSITLVQGWWEHEHEEQRARQSYWGLPPDRLGRYNHLQYEIDQLQQQRHEIDERINRAEQEQRRMLGFKPR